MHSGKDSKTVHVQMIILLDLLVSSYSRYGLIDRTHARMILRPVMWCNNDNFNGVASSILCIIMCMRIDCPDWVWVWKTSIIEVHVLSWWKLDQILFCWHTLKKFVLYVSGKCNVLKHLGLETEVGIHLSDYLVCGYSSRCVSLITSRRGWRMRLDYIPHDGSLVNPFLCISIPAYF